MDEAVPMTASSVSRLMFPGAALLVVLATAPALAQRAPHPVAGSAFSPAATFVETTGADLYAGVCQACHMPDGKGATGAGTYPALAGNRNLATSSYPVTMVVNGSRAMPPLGVMMSDAQVAAVVNYVRNHFGNSYSDQVTAEEVRSARRPATEGTKR